MANIFAILTAIALLAAAFLASKNKEAYAKEIESRQREEKRLATSQARLDSLTKEFNQTEADRKSTEEATVVLRETEASQVKKNKSVEQDIASKKEESESNAARITEIEDKLKETGDIEELVGKMRRTSEDLEQLTADIASHEAQLSDLTGEKTRTEGVIAAYRTKDSNYSNKRSFFSATRIGSLFPAYGFVTLPIGNSSGVVSGSSLDVVRDGAVVAKLRVSSVESGRAAAEIVPDSIAQDTVLMVGDRVVPAADAADAVK
jgi:septal ring factor EnvC (AmiA/AmiB activator)